MTNNNAPLGEATILLLDDEYEERTNWEKWFALCDWKPYFLYASSIQQAQSLLTESNPDIYLIDIFLNGESGFEFLELVRNKRGIKVVLTNSIDQEDIRRSFSSHAILLNKQSTNEDNLKLAEFIHNIWKNVKLPNDDFVLDSSELTQLRMMYEQQEQKILELKNLIKSCLTEAEEQRNEFTKLELLIYGDNNAPGLKERVTVLTTKIEQDKGIIVEIINGISVITHGNKIATGTILFLILLICIVLILYFLNSLLG